MATYRTSMQIIADLLTVTQDSGMKGIGTTSLLTRANLSHSRLGKFLDNLTGAGLVTKIEYDGRHTFVITPEGDSTWSRMNDSPRLQSRLGWNYNV